MTTDDSSPKRPTLVRGGRPAGFDRAWRMRGGSGRGKGRSRWVLGVAIALLALLLVIVPVAARRGADWLWYRELGFERIFLTKVLAQWTLGVAAGVVALVVLYLNARVALRDLPQEEIPAVDRARGGPRTRAAFLTRLAQTAAPLVADARLQIVRLDSLARAGERPPASAYAVAYAVVGDRAATLGWLDSMLVQRNSYVHQIRVDPSFDSVRMDPGYRAWEKRSGLPPMPVKWQSMVAPRPPGLQQY